MKFHNQMTICESRIQLLSTLKATYSYERILNDFCFFYLLFVILAKSARCFPRGVYVCLRECVPGSQFQCYECPLAPHLVGAGRSESSNVLTRPPGPGGAAPQRVPLLCPVLRVQLTGWLPAKLIAQNFLNQSSPAARDHRARATLLRTDGQGSLFCLNDHSHKGKEDRRA